MVQWPPWAEDYAGGGRLQVEEQEQEWEELMADALCFPKWVRLTLERREFEWSLMVVQRFFWLGWDMRGSRPGISKGLLPVAEGQTDWIFSGSSAEKANHSLGQSMSHLGEGDTVTGAGRSVLVRKWLRSAMVPTLAGRDTARTRSGH